MTPKIWKTMYYLKNDDAFMKYEKKILFIKNFWKLKILYQIIWGVDGQLLYK